MAGVSHEDAAASFDPLRPKLMRALTACSAPWLTPRTFDGRPAETRISLLRTHHEPALSGRRETCPQQSQQSASSAQRAVRAAWQSQPSRVAVPQSGRCCAMQAAREPREQMARPRSRSALITIPPPTPIWVDWPWPEWIYSIRRRCHHMLERLRQRRALLQLDDHLLADIGVSRQQALREAGKWFWT
jgi:uncharacterized protein YjiS (DUF1127 family)